MRLERFRDPVGFQFCLQKWPTLWHWAGYWSSVSLNFFSNKMVIIFQVVGIMKLCDFTRGWIGKVGSEPSSSKCLISMDSIFCTWPVSSQQDPLVASQSGKARHNCFSGKVWLCCRPSRKHLWMLGCAWLTRMLWGWLGAGSGVRPLDTNFPCTPVGLLLPIW